MRGREREGYRGHAGRERTLQRGVKVGWVGVGRGEVEWGGMGWDGIGEEGRERKGRCIAPRVVLKGKGIGKGVGWDGMESALHRGRREERGHRRGGSR